MFQSNLRRFAALCGTAIVGSTLSCGRQTATNEITRRGEDVIAMGQTPTLVDSVPGDAMLAGGDISFSGATGGDYLGAGGQQAITGRIHGSLRAAGGTVHVAATIDRNATIAGGEVGLDSVGIIARNAYLVGGSVEVNGNVRGGLSAGGGKVILNGTLGGDVAITAGELTVGPQTRIAGNLTYRVPAGKVHIDPAAHVSGKVTALPPATGSGVWRLLWALGVLLAGVVVIALFPRFVSDAALRLSLNPAQSALFGLGWFCLVPFVIIILAITVIGLPLAVLTTVLYVLILFIGSIPFSIWLGHRLLGARALPGRGGGIVSYLIGEVILILIGIVPVVGGLLVLAALVIGIGTIVVQARSLRQGETAIA